MCLAELRAASTLGCRRRNYRLKRAFRRSRGGQANCANLEFQRNNEINTMVLLFSQELENEAAFPKGHLRKETGQGEVLRRLRHVRRLRVCVFCFEEKCL